MASPRRDVFLLVLCLLLRNVHNQVAMGDIYTVDGVLYQSAKLPCAISIPSNWKYDQLHVMWFKNFTEKLLDCEMKIDKVPDCRSSRNSSWGHISWKYFGHADLEISALQESDGGEYQCWIILSDTYRRRDIRLTIQGVHSDGEGKDTSGQRFGLAETLSSWTIFLLSGWPVAMFLAGLLLARRLCVIRRQRKCRLINMT